MWTGRLGGWGQTLGPWMILASMLLGTLGWYVSGRLRHGEWNWKVPRAARIDLVSGRAPMCEVAPAKEETGSLFKRAARRVLEAI